MRLTCERAIPVEFLSDMRISNDFEVLTIEKE